MRERWFPFLFFEGSHLNPYIVCLLIDRHRDTAALEGFIVPVHSGDSLSTCSRRLNFFKYRFERWRQAAETFFSPYCIDLLYTTNASRLVQVKSEMRSKNNRDEREFSLRSHNTLKEEITMAYRGESNGKFGLSNFRIAPLLAPRLATFHG